MARSGARRDEMSASAGRPVSALRGLIRAYQVVLSPVLGPRCRFLPTCSDYAREALAVHGLLRGSWLSVRRIARCQPFGGCGHDPVPPARDADGEWQIPADGANVKAEFRDSSGKLLGFALTGDATREKMALQKELPAILP